ncbi:olfactory receptor 11H6-like [Zootoca vivipara]|uniref:olfactory receptor 11H6-like n=1 Tax=Zootoca vivipara TaxID=8524 RepID=UPI00293BDB41|nr:olfactory receptor 11H6-like [Zootoca vivipara]
MEMANETQVTEFILLGFGGGPKKHLLLLILLTAFYVLTLAENMAIITLVILDSHLSRLPMYLLLGSFSWLEICYVSTTIPRMLFDLITLHGKVSFQACFLQFYIFFSLGCTEDFFLSAMALDRYLAICHPLHYPQIMSQNACYALMATCWILGFLWNIVPVTLISKMSFCGPNVIDHLLCDPGPLMSLACPPLGNAPFIYQIFVNAVILGNLLCVILSYGAVILSLMKTSNQGSRKKAFSTISFHLMVVTIFYGSVGGVYLAAPGGESNPEITKAATVFYAAVTPVLNPLIYCLRNDKIKEAAGRLLKRMEKWCCTGEYR